MTTARVRPSSRTAWVEASDDPVEVVLALIPHGPPLVLQNSGAEIWLALVDQESVEGLLDHLRERGHDLPVDADAQVRAFVAELMSLGLIETVGDDGAPT